MSRRPPLNDRELLKLLEAGHSQTEAARMMDYPIGTVTARIAKLRERGILRPGNVVAWDTLDQWEREHQPMAYREKEDKEGNTHVIPDVIPKGIPQVIREVIPAAGGLDEQEVKGVREILVWWRGWGRYTHVIPEHHTVIPEGIISKTRRTFWIEDGLHDALRDRARSEGRTMADLVNEALRNYLQGNRGGVDER